MEKVMTYEDALRVLADAVAYSEKMALCLENQGEHRRSDAWKVEAQKQTSALEYLARFDPIERCIPRSKETNWF